jgi:2-methylcitrate dehydratase
MSSLPASSRPAPDRELVDIARYVCAANVGARDAYTHARYCLMDALGCALEALGSPECAKLLGPTVPDTIVPHGARVPGTSYVLDPVKAAFDISCLIRWLDFSDTWWAGGHPSDNLGGILAVADHLSRKQLAAGKAPLTMRDVMTAMIKAYEIQGVLSEGNHFDRPATALDSTILVKIASTAAITQLLGGNVEDVTNALSNAFVDGHPLNIYRMMPNSGPRKSWAAADATARATWLALTTMRGEMGYPSALSAKTWGFSDVLYDGRTLKVTTAYRARVIRDIQFKISVPAQRHSQTAAECAMQLHPLVVHRIGDIDRVIVETHAHAIRMISVEGPLPNFAARDHCLQYVVAVALLDGNINTGSYEDAHAADPRIDALRKKMVVRENKRYTRDYDAKHGNANAIQIVFRGGEKTPRIEYEFPVGDPRRRREGIPLLEQKFRGNLARRYASNQLNAVAARMADQARLEATPVNEFMDLLAIS